MKPTLAAARLLSILAAWATLSLAAPLHGASPGFPFAEDFQSQSLLSTQSTARWTSSGVTLGRARHLHMRSLDFAPRDRRIGNSRTTIVINDIAVRDMDGDGNMDVITAGAGGIFVYYIDKGADLESVQPIRITPASSFRAMAIGDFDRDGYLDVAAAGNLREVVPFMNNKGKRGTFRARPRVSNLRAMELASADMDGDGDLDLVLAQSKGRIVEVHLNDGAGNFNEKDDAVAYIAGHNGGLGVGDFNGDRRMDIVLAKIGGMNMFYLNDGSGGFRDRQLLNHTGTAADYRGIAVGDVDNDGHLDIVVGVRLAENILYLGNGNGGFSTGSRINNSAIWTIDVELADMDGDGDLDLFEGVSRRGHRIYLNQDGVLDSEGLPIRGRTNAVAVGDVDGDGYLGMVRGRSPAELSVARFSERRMSAPSASLFDIGHGQVVSVKVNGDESVPPVVYLTATAVQQRHTDIEYYLSNNGGKRWVRAHPGGNVWFPSEDHVPSEGHDLRWRAELKSRSPVRTTTLTRVGIEDVLQVSIDGQAFRDGGIYTATSHTIGTEFTPVEIRLVNPGNRALTVTGVEVVGEGFVLQREDGTPLSGDIEVEEGDEHDNLRLVFNPEQREKIYNSTLTIVGSEGGRALPEIKVGLKGQGIGAEIGIFVEQRPNPIRVGTSKSQVVRIENNGEELLRVSTPTIVNPEFSLVNPADFPVIVTASKSADIRLWFEPEERGTTATTITFISNAVNGIVTTTLTGKGIAPVISVERPGTDADVSIREINFGNVRVNRPTSLTRVIKNKGDLPLIVTAVTVENAQFELLAPVIEDASSKTVPVNRTLALILQFNPQRRATTQGRLIIHSDAFNITQSRVMLQGTGTGPEIDFAGDNKILFGNVRVGQSRTGSVVIKNTGDEPLIVSGVRSGTTAADVMSAFSWVPPLPEAASQTVAAGTTAMLTVRFRPPDVDDFVDRLAIDSDAINTLERPLDVKGEGVASEMVIVITDIDGKPENNTSPTVSHDFGARLINTSTSRKVFISNNGDVPLEVRIPEIDDGGPFQWEKRLDMVTVPARNSPSTLTLVFKPDTRGPFSTTLTFFSNAFNNTRTDIVLTGRGLAPMIGVEVNNERVASGAGHFLGELRTFENTTLSVSVHNHGDADLEITERLRLSAEYLPHDIPDIRGILHPTSSIEVMVTLMVKDTGDIAGSLMIESNDPTTPTYTVRLTSTGVEPVMVVQVGGTTMTSGKTFDLRTRVYREVTTDIVVWNRGRADLKVDDIGLARGGRIVESVGRYRLPGGAMAIPKNSSRTWTLHFRPFNAATIHKELIKIVSDNDEASTFTLNVRGVGTRPDLATSFRGCSRERDIHCHLDDIRAGVTTSVELIISNQGNELLTGNIMMKHSHSDYQVYRIDQTGDFALAPRESTTRTISFFPWDANPNPPGHSNHGRAVWIKIRTNDPYKWRRTIDVWSSIVGPEMHVDIGEPVPLYTGSTETRKQEHDFATVVVDSPETVAVTIRNLGTEPLTVTASVSGSAYRLLNEDGSSAENRLITIGAGRDKPLDLRFTPPSGSSSYRGVLTITSNDYDEGMHTVNLAGRGIQPGMKVFLERDGNRRQHYSGGVYDLGNVTIGQPINTFIYLGNSGTANLNVSHLDVSGRGFSVESELAALPERGVVESGVSAAYVGVLKFKPGWGSHTGMLTIRSDDINGTEFTIRLRANGIPTGFDICMWWEPDSWPGLLSESCGKSFSAEHDFGEVLVGSGPQIMDIDVSLDEGYDPQNIYDVYLENNEDGKFDIILPDTVYFNNYYYPSVLFFTPI